MKMSEREGNGVFKRIGRVVGAPFGRGGEGDQSDGIERRGYSSRRVVERIGIPLASRDDVDWAPARYGEYYARSTAVHAAVRVLAEAVSRPPLEVWQRRSPGSRSWSWQARAIRCSGCWSAPTRSGTAGSCCE